MSRKSLRHSMAVEGWGMAVRKAGAAQQEPKSKGTLGSQVGQGRLKAFRPTDPGIWSGHLQRQNEHRFIQCIGYWLGCRECLESIH